MEHFLYLFDYYKPYFNKDNFLKKSLFDIFTMTIE